MIKKIFLVFFITSFAIHARTWQVDVSPTKNISLEDSFKTTKSGWNFELRNKDKKDAIYVTLEQNGIKYLNDQKIPAATGSKEKDVHVIRLVGLDASENSTIKISYKPKQQQAADFIYILRGSPKDKTYYLSFEKGILRPQTGTFGKTQSSLSLKNNVLIKEIMPSK